MKMVKKDWLLVVLIGVLVLIVGTGLLVKFGMERAAAEEILTKFPDRGVPRMNIALNGVTLEEINAGSKDVKYEGNEVAVYEGEEKTLEAEGVRVKGRGNGTWLQEKKPYQIKFDKKVDLFGLGKAKKWVLLANAADASNLRTELAFNLEKKLDMKYALSGDFVELYIDDKYEGLYYITHAIEIDKSSIDLKNSMGIVVELDNVYGDQEKHFRTKGGELLVVKDVVAEDNRDLAVKDFINSFNVLEGAIEDKDFEAINRVADVESFAKYYLLSEFSVNPDAYWTSFYFYKDGVGDKIHAGPGWDFDLAFANRGWENWLGEVFYSPTETMVRKKELRPKEFYDEMGVPWYETSLNISEILFDMMDIPEFADCVDRAFREYMAGGIDDVVLGLLDKLDGIDLAAQKNIERWGLGDCKEELEKIITWLRERFKYFESLYGD